MRFILVSAVASALVIGVGPWSWRTAHQPQFRHEQDMGSIASEAKGDMGSEHEQMKENFRAK